jgi:2-haloacid dehalogenase
MNKVDTIVFDLGNVLIDWNPSYLFDKVFENDIEKKSYFFKNICTEEWHARQDAGRPVMVATDELVNKYPDWEQPIRAFYDRWKEMFHGPINGSVEILKELKARNYKLFALTNWSAELFKLALEDFEFLHWFEGIVVSGEEKMNKPVKDIYLILLNRYHIDPERTIFIDDKLKNVQAAEEAGMKGIQFQSPEQLKQALKDYGCL